MKKYVLLVSIVLTSFVLFAQDVDVPMTNQPLITKRTASWCPLCGGWGWSLFRGLLEDNSDKALLIAAHYSGEYQNPVAVELTNNFGGFSQPIFYVNNTNQSANSGNSATVRTDVKAQVENINGQTPVVQAGLRAEVDDTYSVYVEAKARFFEATEGEYYLGVYLIERDFFAYQAGQGENAHHKQILRLAYNGLTFGEFLATGNIEADTEESFNFVIRGEEIEQAGVDNLEGMYDDNFEVAAIIWKKEGDNYQVVNTNSTGIRVLSSAGEISQLSLFRAWPLPAGNQLTAELELAAPLHNASLVLLGADGARLRTLFTGGLPEGPHTFSFERDGLPAGQYFLQLSSDKGTSSRPVLFK